MAVYTVRKEMIPICREIIHELYDAKSLSVKRMQRIRNYVTKKSKFTDLPRNLELIQAYRDMVEEGVIEPREDVLHLIQKRKVRTLSGIANITVMTKAHPCPGKCIFCPTQAGMPKSYLDTQPAMLRAVRNSFDPYLQTKTRLNGLKAQGHDVTKIDVRTAGGTWSSYPPKYQDFFIKAIYYALNEGPGEFQDLEKVHKEIDELTLEELIKENETTECRCVGLWVETRPDWVTKRELRRLRNFGVTGIELGIQTTDDEVNEKNRRGHGVKDSIEATERCRNVGLKICHHLMPNLPFSSHESDLQSARDLFEMDLKPDYVKIYPCMVLPYTELKEMYEKDPSIYRPYNDEELIDILGEIMKSVPEYCRIIRVLRDFAAPDVLAGTKTSNLRQIMQQRGINSRCIRSREIKNNDFDPEDVECVVRDYRSNNGDEYFVSFEDIKQDKLIGLVRLRLPDNTEDALFEELKGAALLRELHVYGKEQSLKNTPGVKSKTQHKGYGRRLMAKAEEIAKDQGFDKIAVISAIGTREYYKKLGYELEGTYMVKSL